MNFASSRRVCALLVCCLPFFAAAQAPQEGPALKDLLPLAPHALRLELGARRSVWQGQFEIGERVASLEGARAIAAEWLNHGLQTGPGTPCFELAHSVDIAGVYHLQYRQLIQGLPLESSCLEILLSSSAQCTRIAASDLSEVSTLAPFRLDRVQAMNQAEQALDLREQWLGASRQVAFQSVSGETRPAWRLEVFDPSDPRQGQILLIDGENGSLLAARASQLEGVGGNIDGRGIATGPQTMSAPVVLPMANIFVSLFDTLAAHERITDNDCADTEVVLSADGSTLAWTSACDGDREIWIANADGSNAHALTVNVAADFAPCLSADGTRVVFVSDRDGDFELFGVNSDGSGLSQLTLNAAADHSPALSADGERVVYVSEIDGDREIFSLLYSSPSPLQRTSNTIPDHSPALALDGELLAWVREEAGDSEIYAATFSAGSAYALTVNNADDIEPAVAPDSSRVVFASRLPAEEQNDGDPSASQQVSTRSSNRIRRHQYDIFEIASDGSALDRKTTSDSDEREPTYAGDGAAIAYASNAGGDFEIEVLELISGFAIAITNNSQPDRSPALGANAGSGAWIGSEPDAEVFAWAIGSGDLAIGTSDEFGSYALDFPDARTASLYARLRGPFARISDLDPRWGELRETASVVTPDPNVDLSFNASGAEEGPTGQVTAWVHTNRAHDGLAAVLTRPPLSMPLPLSIDEPLSVRTQFPTPLANAFYNPERTEATFFIGAGPLRPNTAYDTVILHEYGHFFDDKMGGISSGSTCEAAFALSEATADSVAMLLSGSPVLGDDFFGPGTYLRNYAFFPWEDEHGSRGRQYGCEDCTIVAGSPEVHDHGEAFAGVAWTLHGILGAVTAENLVFGALAGNPVDMPGAVGALFALAATPAFGGSGDPTSSPHALALYTAAAMHGFDGPTRADFGSKGCFLGDCIPSASHRVIGTEWLGTLVLPETSCETYFSPEDDGLIVPPHWAEESSVPLVFTLNVNPALQDSGRYGAPAGETQLPKRRVYLNAWLLIDDAMGGYTLRKILGSGSGSGVLGPDSFESGVDAIAFNPDTWAGSSYTFSCTVDAPAVASDRPAILRVRLDYGEDAGRLEQCLSDSSLDEHCGVARFGEVEDYQIAILNQ